MKNPDDVFRKVRAYADQPGATFTTEGVRTVGRGKTLMIDVKPNGGVLMRLTADEADIWLSGYVTGRKAAS